MVGDNVPFGNGGAVSSLRGTLVLIMQKSRKGVWRICHMHAQFIIHSRAGPSAYDYTGIFVVQINSADPK